MKNFIFIIISTSIITLITAQAAVYKGQTVFFKECLSCHKDGQSVVASKTKAQWGELLIENGIGLSKIHLTNKEAKESWKYFYSKKYTKKVKHLKDFLIEYAKDSGNIPACN